MTPSDNFTDSCTNRPQSPTAHLQIRTDVRATDRQAVREIVESTGFFHQEEIEVAVELVDERLAKGLSSGYHFLFLELNDRVAGYACFGPIACTKHSFDLYWIAVHSDFQRTGLGKHLAELSELQIRGLGGNRVYADTSGKEQYVPTRRFYERCGYQLAASLTDFYDTGDDKIIFMKLI
jgi:D-alanine-D-alanine ligase